MTKHHLKRDKVEIFREAFFEYHTPLSIYAHQYVLNKDEAKDIVQDVFCEIWQRIDEIDLSIPLKPLLYKYTRNRAIDYLRSAVSKNTKLDSLSINNNFKILIVDSIEEELESKDLDLAIQELVNQLPPQCQQVYKLSRIDKLKNREIAAELNINIKTVEKHISKALNYIRGYLVDGGYITSIILITHLLSY